MIELLPLKVFHLYLFIYLFIKSHSFQGSLLSNPVSVKRACTNPQYDRLGRLLPLHSLSIGYHLSSRLKNIVLPKHFRNMRSQLIGFLPALFTFGYQ